VQRLIESVDAKRKHEAQRKADEAEKRRRKAAPPKKPRPPPNRKKATKTPVGRARKIRLYPTTEQRSKLAQWFGAARWTYNQCLAEIRAGHCKLTKKELRARTLNADVLGTDDDKQWLKEVPYDIRDEGMADLLKAYKSNLAKRDLDPSHAFEIRFRSRKRLDSETIVAHAKHWANKSGMYTWLRQIRSTEPLPATLKYDARLKRTKAGAYYLCVPLSSVVRGENQVPSHPSVVALDPGVRTFNTCYDPVRQQCVKWGTGDIGGIYRLCHWLDDLMSRLSQKKTPDGGGFTHRQRWRMKQAASRMRSKIRHLIDDVQRKLIKWLCENYHLVLLPKFDTQHMISKRDGRRRIRSKTARAMATWAHYRFRTRLLSKSQNEYPWCRVELVDESYTSKTCGGCGALHDKLGGAKLYRCPKSCGFVADRDLNGARNIYLRFCTTMLESTGFCLLR
jgi:putative transposase